MRTGLHSWAALEMAEPIGADLVDIVGKVASIGVHGGQGLDHSQEDPRPTTTLPSGPCIHALEPPTLEDHRPTIAHPPTSSPPTHSNTTFDILGDGQPTSLGAQPIPREEAWGCSSRGWEAHAPTSQETAMSIFNDPDGEGDAVHGDDDAKGRFDRIWQTCQKAFGFWNPTVFPRSFTWYETSRQLVMRHPTSGHWESQDEDDAMEHMSVDAGTGSEYNLWANSEDNLTDRDGSGSVGDEFSDPGASTPPTSVPNHPSEATDMVYKVWPNNPAPHYWNLPSAAMGAKPPVTTPSEKWLREKLYKHKPEAEIMQELEASRYPRSFKADVRARMRCLQSKPQGPRITHITRDNTRMAQAFQHLTWQPGQLLECHCDWGKCTDFIKELKRTKVADEHDTFGRWQEVLL